ncbi:MAG TPA: hypothetical protein PKY56_03980 [Candidatus Kapabacteria bacterium]|nr:hypothetical protein [Candidatus Kapabacteria bacterium]
MVDVVYPLGNGSLWNDNELRYSLRSLEKNLLDLRNVYIIGRLPNFITNVINIPVSDSLRQNKDGNIIHKVITACNRTEISPIFVRLSDDQLFLKPIRSSDIDFWYLRQMTDDDFKDLKKLNNWGKRLFNTYKILKQQGLTTFNYDCHIPSLIDKYSFVDIMQKYPYNLEREGFTINSLYFNNLKNIGKQINESTRFNIEFPMEKEKIKIGFEKNIFLNYNERGRNNNLQEVIEETFGFRSKFEIF